MSLFNFSANGQNLPWGGFFHSFEMLKSITDHADRAIWTFWGMAPEAIAKAALAINQNLQFRWGNGPVMSIPHEYVIHAMDLKYIGDKSFCKLHLMDCRLHMMSNSAFSSYPHKSFSDIVSAVTKSYSKLPAAVVKADKYIGDILQTGANHWAFLTALKNEGCKALANGDSDYRLFFRGGNELHFHPPDYNQSPVRTITVLGGSTIPEIGLQADPWKPIVHGSVGYKTSQFLKNEVKPQSAHASQADAFSGQKVLGTLAGGAQAIKSTLTGAFLGKFFHPHHDTAELITKDAKVGAENAVYASNHMEFSMTGDPGIEPGDLVALNYIDRTTGSKLEAHGLWLVEKVYHHIPDGSTVGKTKLVVSRTGAQEIGSSKIPGLTSASSGGGSSQYSGSFGPGGIIRAAVSVT